MSPTKFRVASTQCPTHVSHGGPPTAPKSWCLFVLWAPGSPGSARRTSGSRSPQLCHWARSTGSPVHDLEEQEGEKRVMIVLHIAGNISAVPGPGASGSFSCLPVNIPSCSFSLHHVCPAPSPLNCHEHGCTHTRTRLCQDSWWFLHHFG